MKKVLLLAGVLCSLVCSAQFPNTDSLHRFNNRYIRNSAVEAFSNLRLNTLMHGIIQHIDSAKAGVGGSLGVDTLYPINDSVVRYTKNGVTLQFSLKGTYDFRRKVDTAFAFNDSIIRFRINGANRDVLIRGKDVRKLNDSTIIIGGETVHVGGGGGTETIDQLSLKRSTKLYSKVPVAKNLAELRAIPTSEADTGFVYMLKIGGEIGEFSYDPSDATSADDSTMTVVGFDGARFKRVFERIIYPEWWGAKGDNITNDAPAFNRMFRWMENQPSGNFSVFFKSNRYYISERIVLPKTLQTIPGQAYPWVFINGQGVHIRTDQAIDMLYRMPQNDADVSLMNNNYKMVIDGLYLQGDRTTTGQVGARLGTGYGWEFNRIHFYGLDTGFVGSFFTKSSWNNNFFTVNKSTDIILRSLAGTVGAQSVVGSASNDNTIRDNRFFKETNSYAAVVLMGTDNTVIDHIVIEGAQPLYGIYSDYQGSNNSNTLLINDVWFEGFTPGATSTNFRILGSGLTRINNVQRTYADTLFNFDGSQANAEFVFDGFTYGGNLATVPFSVGTTDPTFTGKSITFLNCERNMAAMLKDPTKWASGILPVGVRVEYWKTSNGGWAMESNNAITIIPRIGQAQPFNRFLYMDNNIQLLTDNGGSLGGWYGSGDGRFRAGHFGTTGLYIDNVARFYWGRAGHVTPDLALGRDSIGQLGIRDIGNGYMNIKAGRGLFTQRTGYTNLLSLEDLGAFDFVSKGMLQDAINNLPVPNTAIYKDSTIAGANTFDDPLRADTINLIATKSDIANFQPVNLDSFYTKSQADSIHDEMAVSGGADGIGPVGVTHDSTLLNTGKAGDPLSVNMRIVYDRVDSIAALITAGSLGGTGTTNRIPKFTASATVGNSNVSDNGSVVTLDVVAKYNNDKSGTYDALSLITQGDLSAAITGISASGTADVIKTTVSVLTASSGLNTAKVYYTSDIGKEGTWYYAGTVANTSSHNGGTVIVTADLKQYKRAYAGDLRGEWFGIVNGSSAAAANTTAMGVVLAAYGDNQKIKLGGGDWYFSAPIQPSNTNYFKRFDFECDGNMYFKSSSGFILTGIPILNVKIEGILGGPGTPGVQDSVGYAAYPASDGIRISNLYNSKIEVSEIKEFRNGIHHTGEGTGASFLGSQYNEVHFRNIHHCHTQIRIGTYDQPASGGNFSNETVWYGGQIGRGSTHFADFGKGGTYGLVVDKDPSNPAPNYGIGGHKFYNCDFEGLWYGIVGDDFNFTTFFGGSIERGLVRWPISLSNSSAEGIAFRDNQIVVIDTSWFRPGRIGLRTSINGSIWAADPAAINATTNQVPLGDKAFSQASVGKNTFLVSSDIYPGFTQLNLRFGFDYWIKKAERYTVHNGTTRYDDIIRHGAYKQMPLDVALSNTSDTIIAPYNVGWVRVNANEAKVIKIQSSDISFNGAETFVLELLTATPVTFVNSATNAVLISSSNFTTAGKYSCTWRYGAYTVYRDDGSGTGGSSKWVDAPNAVDIFRNSRVGIGITTNPTARLHVAGSTASSSNTAPIKIGEGLLNVPENGAIERDASDLYGTFNSVRSKFLKVPTQNGAAGDVLTSNGVGGYSFQQAPGNTNIYNSNGTVAADRTITQGFNDVKFLGAGELQKYNGLMRFSSAENPISGAIGLTLFSNKILGQTFNGSVWSTSALNLNEAGHATNVLGSLTIGSPLSHFYGGTGLGALGTPGQTLRVNSAGTALEYTSSSGSAWESSVPTVAVGPAGVSGDAATISFAAGATNSSGKITITTGTRPTGFLTSGNLWTITFNTSSGAMAGNVITLTPGNANAAALQGDGYGYMINGTNTATLVLTTGVLQSTTYTWYYMAEKK